MGVRLPPEYQEVTCIIGQGTQYIDTGFVLNSECRVQGRFDLYGDTAELRNVKALFGSRDSNYNKTFAIFNVSYAPRVDYGKTLKSHSFSYVSINSRNVVDFDMNAGIATVNGNTYTFADSLKPFTCTLTALIFSAHTGNTVDTRHPRGEIVYLKITDENGVVVRDMVPCYRKSDNKPGMYDLADNRFYTNAGTGDFVVGPDVLETIGDISPWLMERRRLLMKAPPRPVINLRNISYDSMIDTGMYMLSEGQEGYTIIISTNWSRTPLMEGFLAFYYTYWHWGRDTGVTGVTRITDNVTTGSGNESKFKYLVFRVDLNTMKITSKAKYIHSSGEVRYHSQEHKITNVYYSTKVMKIGNNRSTAAGRQIDFFQFYDFPLTDDEINRIEKIIDK